MSDPRKDFVGHGQVPVNVVQSRLLIVSMGQGGGGGWGGGGGGGGGGQSDW